MEVPGQLPSLPSPKSGPAYVVLSKFKVHACCTESDKRNTFPCFSALYLTQLMTAPPKKTKHLGNREKQICLYAISINIKQVVYDVISFKSRDKNQTLPGCVLTRSVFVVVFHSSTVPSARAKYLKNVNTRVLLTQPVSPSTCSVFVFH